MKRIFLIAAALILCCLAGCKNGQNTVNSAAENIIEPPENGWTVEELVSTIYFNGSPIKLPLKISDLGDKYDFGKDDAYFLGTSTTVSLSYDKKIIAVVTLENCLDIEDVNNSNISVIALSDLITDKNYIKVNGMSLSSSFDDVISLIGEPQQTDESNSSGVLIYKVRGTEDTLMTVHYNNEGELTTIYIHLQQ